MAAGHFAPSVAADRLRTVFGDGKLAELVRQRRLETLPGLLADLPTPLLSVAQIEQGLGRGLIGPEHLRVFAGRTKIDLDKARLRRGAGLDLDVLAQVARQGITIVLENIHREMPALGDLAHALSVWLDEKITITAVLTYGGTSGLARHHDAPNVFILQLDGSKAWTLFGQPLEIGAKSVPDTPENGPERHLTLHAGDVMFLPAGLRHECAAGGYSLHIGASIKHGRASDLAESFAATIADDPAMRAPLLHLLGEEAREEQIAAYRARLHALVDGFDWSGKLAARHAAERSSTAFSLPEPNRDPD